VPECSVSKQARYHDRAEVYPLISNGWWLPCCGIDQRMFEGRTQRVGVV
jgi:hypothetical protein